MAEAEDPLRPGLSTGGVGGVGGRLARETETETSATERVSE